MYHVCTWCLRVLASLELDLRMALCYHLETGNQNPGPLQEQKDTEPFFTFSFNFKVCVLVYV